MNISDFSDITTMSAALTALIMPYCVGLFILVITLWIKDFSTKLAKGFMFRISSTFKEGDKVILDDERALIVKIGLTQTVFGIKKGNYGDEGEYCWRYVPNERIPFLKLEKVIFEENRRDSDET
jgi:hypothetical protein